jgi:hypothetical protein
VAIELEIIECSTFGSDSGSPLPVLRGPITARQRITAAGLSAAFDASTKLILVRNFGDAVHIRLNDTAVSTQAATSDPTSMKLRATSDEVSFKIDPSLAVKLDVRAA